MVLDSWLSVYSIYSMWKLKGIGFFFILTLFVVDLHSCSWLALVRIS